MMSTSALNVNVASAAVRAVSSGAVVIATAAVVVAGDKLLPTTSARDPHTPLEPVALHSAAKGGVVMLNSVPSGETQFTLAAMPPTDAVVVLLKAGPAEAGGGEDATRMR